MPDKRFWEIRAAKYDKLFWANDNSYLKAIVQLADLKKSNMVLDVGSGPGIVARAMKPFVKHVVAIDMSDAMLSRGQWEGVSVLRGDITEAWFADSVFDRIVARMVFHHIFEKLDRAVIRCYDMLKPEGRLVVAEGVPPSDDDDVVAWFSEMFAHKEVRRTFRSKDVAELLRRNGFKRVTQHTHVTEGFSVRNWLENSGLEKSAQDKILRMHRQAPLKIKRLYDMAERANDCIVTTKNIITLAEKV
jgi:ubiquinone/menaquinone biosynthesis C-methylase UbiE